MRTSFNRILYENNGYCYHFRFGPLLSHKAAIIVIENQPGIPCKEVESVLDVLKDDEDESTPVDEVAERD